MRRFTTNLYVLTYLVFATSGCDSAAQSRAKAQSDHRAEAASQETTTAATDLGTRSRGVDWPDFLGPDRNSKSPETGIITSWPPEGPRLVWQRELGQGYSIGSVSSGRYYQFDRVQDSARLTCLRAETGEELWQFTYASDYVDTYEYDNGPRCTPVIDEDRVYIFGAEGMLHCLRTSDGQVIWKCDATRRFGVFPNLFGVGSTPLIEQNLLIAIIGGSPPEDQRIPRGEIDRVSGNGTGIVAFDKFTGAVKYKLTKELASYSSPIAASIHGTRYCFAFCRGGLVAFDPQDGAVHFRYPWRAPLLESVNASTPVIVDDQVFFSEAYGPGSLMIRVQPGGFGIEWRDPPKSRRKAMKAQFITPVHHQGYLYGCSCRYPHNAELRCIQWATGKVMWSEKYDRRCSLLYVDGHFVCLTDHGKLQLLKVNPHRYQVVAEVDLGAGRVAAKQATDASSPLLTPPCWAAPILSHGLLYVRGKNRLLCLELIPK